MKNNYITRVQQQIKKAAEESAIKGFEFALNLVFVALNEKFGFGKTRLDALKTEVQRIWRDEFAGDHDREAAAYALDHRIKQINGEAK